MSTHRRVVTRSIGFGMQPDVTGKMTADPAAGADGIRPMASVVDDTESEDRGESPRRDETRAERVDRELIELLNELRVALPGVQFLFAFLLILPFQQTIGRTTEFQRDVYFVAALLIAPAAQHRILFRMRDKENLLRRSSHSALWGLVFLAIAIAAALLLVVDVLFGLAQAWIAVAVFVGLVGWWWFAVPFWKRAHNQQDILPEE
jgi:hypothetical protein